MAASKMKMNAASLPISLIESEILPRLPAKSIGRFKSVCKRWKSFLSTHTFTKMHLHHVTINDHRKLLLVDGIQSLTLPLTDTEEIFSNYPKPDPRAQCIVGHLDGLVCLAASEDEEGPKLGFWNPSTGACKNLSIDPVIVNGLRFLTLPPITDIKICNPNPDPTAQLIVGSLDGLICLASFEVPTKLGFWNPLTGAYKKLSIHRNIVDLVYCSSYEVVGFYKDDSTDDYKLLYLMNGGDCGAYIYSNRLDSWREIDFLVENAWLYTHGRFCRCSHATFFGKSLYFIVKYNSSESHSCWILHFDVDTEKFREIRFPPVPAAAADYWGNLVVIDGCIHLCVSYKINIDHDVYGDLWKMDGDGWVKKVLNDDDHWNWLAILEENNSLNFADYFNYSGWAYRSRRTVYVETLVSPNL